MTRRPDTLPRFATLRDGGLLPRDRGDAAPIWTWAALALGAILAIHIANSDPLARAAHDAAHPAPATCPAKGC